MDPRLVRSPGGRIQLLRALALLRAEAAEAGSPQCPLSAPGVTGKPARGPDHGTCARCPTGSDLRLWVWPVHRGGQPCPARRLSDPGANKKKANAKQRRTDDRSSRKRHPSHAYMWRQQLRWGWAQAGVLHAERPSPPPPSPDVSRAEDGFTPGNWTLIGTRKHQAPVPGAYTRTCVTQPCQALCVPRKGSLEPRVASAPRVGGSAAQPLPHTGPRPPQQPPHRSPRRGHLQHLPRALTHQSGLPAQAGAGGTRGSAGLS